MDKKKRFRPRAQQKWSSQYRIDPTGEEVSLFQLFNFDYVFSFEHLFQASYDCQKGVSWKAHVQRFSIRRLFEIEEIYSQLQAAKYDHGSFFKFRISERGKRRNICAETYRDRVVQRVLCQYFLDPLLRRTLVYSNAASQPGKGTDFARDRFARDLIRGRQRYGAGAYLVQYDIHDYFASVDSLDAFLRIEQYCLRLLQGCPAEKQRDAHAGLLLILEVLKKVLLASKCLELGNQASQTIAVWYLNPLDHFIAEVLRLPYSGRYMDDGYVICPSKEAAQEVRHAVENKVKELSLLANPRKTKVTPIGNRHSFLKTTFLLEEESSNKGRNYRHFAVMRFLNAEVIRHYKRHYKKLLHLYEQGGLSLEDLEASRASFKGTLMRASNYPILQAKMDKWFKERES